MKVKLNGIKIGAMGAALVAGLVMSVAVQAATVQVIGNASDGYKLLRDGKPYFIKGVGGDGSKQLLVKFGGNSFRTWGADKVVSDCDEAQGLGLTVCEGIWLGHTEQGFNWNDPASIAKQREMVRNVVLQGRDKPALLIWCLGNEMEGYGQGDDPVMWNEIEYLAKMVKVLDPNHPIMTVIAEIGGKKVPSVNKYCPDIDIVGINSYGGGPSLYNRYVAAGGVKPFIVTEFGPPGTWETGKTSWGVPPELTSTQKADTYRATYVNTIENKPLCLGSYAFLWSHKQEATPTWYGMMLPDGSILASADEMRHLWTGEDEGSEAPSVSPISVDATQVEPGATIQASVTDSDPQNDALQQSWVLRTDDEVKNVNGSAEPSPADLANAVVSSSANSAEVKMPSVPGAYRLYLTLHDAHGHAATANVPLYVKASTASIK